MKLSVRLAHARQQLSTPGRGRTLILRRGLAGALVLAAGLSAAASVREHPQVYVFARDVPAGSVVGDGDVELRRVPKEVIPAAALGPGTLRRAPCSSPRAALVRSSRPPDCWG